jgi:UDP-N-acetylmuramate--alanine ligase
MDEFGKAFHRADGVWVLDIYAASEKPIGGVTAEAMVERIRRFGHRSAEYAGTMDHGVAAILEAARPGDLVLTLGAGNVWQAGDAILAALRGRE